MQFPIRTQIQLFCPVFPTGRSVRHFGSVSPNKSRGGWAVWCPPIGDLAVFSLASLWDSVGSSRCAELAKQAWQLVGIRCERHGVPWCRDRYPSNNLHIYLYTYMNNIWQEEPILFWGPRLYLKHLLATSLQKQSKPKPRP